MQAASPESDGSGPVNVVGDEVTNKRLQVTGAVEQEGTNVHTSDVVEHSNSVVLQPMTTEVAAQQPLQEEPLNQAEWAGEDAPVRIDTIHHISPSVSANEEAAAAAVPREQGSSGEGGSGHGPSEPEIHARAARQNWELSEEEKAEMRAAKWPPSCGYAISLACFGVEEGAVGGPAQTRVHHSLVHKCDDLKAGDECLCLDPRDGQQWLATIKKLTPHHALVHYKGWSKSTDSWVTRDKLALKPSASVLERIKQYNDHSKLRQGGAPKNQLSAAHPRPSESTSLDTGTALRGREVRSRMRGVELYGMPSTRYPQGQWRAVRMIGNQKHSIGGLFSSKEEAWKAWSEHDEKRSVSGGSSAATAAAAAAAKEELQTVPPPPNLSAGQGSKFSEGGALGARVSVDMGRSRRCNGTVIAWIGPKMLYQISLDGPDAQLVHLHIPHKRVQLLKSSHGKAPPAPKAAAPHGDVGEQAHASVIEQLGGEGILDELQDICDTAHHDHVLGAHALQMARLRYLGKACQAHGIYVCRGGLQGTMAQVGNALQMAIHHKLKPDSGAGSEVDAGGKGEVGDRHGRVDAVDEDRKFTGVRLRRNGTKEDRDFNKWEAFVEMGGETHVLGYYARKVEAARAWDMAAKRMLPRSTPLNLSDSLEFLPCPELKETISRITVAVATCRGVRPVLPALTGMPCVPGAAGSAGLIPMPAPVGGARGKVVGDKKMQGGSGGGRGGRGRGVSLKKEAMKQVLGRRRSDIRPLMQARFGGKARVEEGARRSGRPRGRPPGTGAKVGQAAGDVDKGQGLQELLPPKRSAFGREIAGRRAFPARGRADRKCSAADASSAAHVVSRDVSRKAAQAAPLPCPAPAPLLESANPVASLVSIISTLSAFAKASAAVSALAHASATGLRLPLLPPALLLPDTPQDTVSTCQAARAGPAARQISAAENVVIPAEPVPGAMPTVGSEKGPVAVSASDTPVVSGGGAARKSGEVPATTSPAPCWLEVGAIACNDAAAADCITTPPEIQPHDAAAARIPRDAIQGVPVAAAAGAGARPASQARADAGEGGDTGAARMLASDGDSESAGGGRRELQQLLLKRAEQNSALAAAATVSGDPAAAEAAACITPAAGDGRHNGEQQQEKEGKQGQEKSGIFDEKIRIAREKRAEKKRAKAALAAAACLEVMSFQKRVRKKKRLFGEADDDDDDEEEQEEEAAAGAASSKSQVRGLGGRGGESCGKKRGRKPKSEQGADGSVRKKGREEMGGEGRGDGVCGDMIAPYMVQGRQCEILWEGEWWAGRVVSRGKQRLRVSYVGGTEEDEEWIPEAEWRTRIRAPQAESDDGDGAKIYRGVERAEDGLFCSVVHTCGHSNSPSLSGSRPAPAQLASTRVTLGTFTTAREAAEHFDFVLLECTRDVGGVSNLLFESLQLNLESSRRAFRQCKDKGCAIFPEDLGDTERAAVKDALVAQLLAQQLQQAEPAQEMQRAPATLSLAPVLGASC